MRERCLFSPLTTLSAISYRDPCRPITSESNRGATSLTVRRRFPSLLEQGHADALPASRRIHDHGAVARLKDVQGEIGLGEQDNIREREHRNSSWDGKRRRTVRLVAPRLLSLVIGLHGSR